MKITPITKKYTNPSQTYQLSFASRNNVSSNNANSFYCPKTIVKSTLDEFSNSRGQYLADIDLSDIHFNDAQDTISSNTKKNLSKTIVKSTPITFGKYTNTQYLADMPLTDYYELPKKQDSKNLHLPFCGAYPQFLVDQDATEQYETVSTGINDIAKSTYCSFSGTQDKPFISKLCSVLKKYLSI